MNPNKKIAVLLMPLILTMSMLIVLSACSILRQPLESVEALKQCEFKIIRVDPKIEITRPKITLDGLKDPEILIELQTQIEITNPTKKNIRLNRIQLDMIVNGDHFSTLDTAKKVSIDAGMKRVIQAAFTVNAQTATREIVNKLEGKTVQYQINGKFYFDFNGVEIPFSVEMVKGEG